MADDNAKIVDYRGRPIKRSSLTREIATPTLSGVRTNWYSSVSTGLTPESLATIIVQVDQNDILSYLTLAEEMEERDLHYASVLSTRKNAVSGLKRAVDAVSDEDIDVEIADFVREHVMSASFTNLVKYALDALGKGYAVSEIMWDRGSVWAPREYEWRDPRYFQFDQDTGAQIRMRDDAEPVDGLPLEPYKFVYHLPNIKMGLPIRGGLARLAVVAYMCKGYTLKDWMAFSEIFGMPIRVGRHGPEATAEQKSKLLSALASIGTDAACIIPEGMDIEFKEAAKTSGGEKLYLALADWLDRQTSKGVLGQVASTEGTPGKLGADDVQQQVRDDIKVDDAFQLTATLQRDVIKPLVDLNYKERVGGPYPLFRIYVEEPEDLVALSNSLPEFIDRGLRVESSQVLDKFGLQEAEEGAELLQPKGKTAGPANEGDEPPEPGEPPADGEPDDEEDQDLIDAAGALMRKVMAGEKLTPDQRGVMALAFSRATAADDGGKDEIDRLTDAEVSDWRRLMDPVLQPVLDHAEASSSYDEFLGGLEKVMAKVDSTEFAKRLAVSTFKTRGLGDGTDKI